MDGLVGYWNSKVSQDGSLVDLSGNNNNGLLTNASIGQNGVIFNGYSYISIPVPDQMQVLTDGTIDFIVKVDEIEEHGWSTLVSDEFNDQSYLYRDGNELIHIHSGVFDTSNEDRYDDPEYRIHLGSLYDELYISYRYDNDTQDVVTFIQNINTGATTTKVFKAASQSLLVEGDILTIGRDFNRSSFHGRVNSIKIYNRYLADEELNQNILAYHDVGL